MSVIPYMPYRAVIFSFHMPLFFILSGYFYKEDFEFKKRLKKDFSRLVIPYIFTATILFLEICLRAIANKSFQVMLIGLVKVFWGSGSPHASYFFANIPSIGAIWFLLALFWCKTVYNYIICNYFHNNHYHVIVIVSSVLATLIDRYIINLPFGILPGLSAMLFFYIGDIIKKRVINHYLNLNFLIILCLVCWILSICYSHIWMVACYYGIYPIDILGACGGTAFVYWLAKIITTTRFSSLFSWFGVNSLIILCFHLLELNWGVCSRLHIPDIWYCQLPVKVLFCMTMTYITYKIKFTRWVFKI